MTVVLPSPSTRSRQGSPWHRSSLDHSQSRRIAKTTDGQTTVYVDDGWNVIAEYTTLDFQAFDIQTFDILRSYLFGLDLSGSMQGAGGVGGLLSVKIHNSTSSTAYDPCYDGNGNVTEYLDSTGAVIAHFEYDPFGNTVVNSDTAGLFNYKFSTKPLDLETGFYYYGYRYYDPLTDRWPSKDPIEEEGGVNLYGFVRNDGIDINDLLGLSNVPLIPFNCEWALGECDAMIWVGHGSYIWEAVRMTIKSTVDAGVTTAKVGFLSCNPRDVLRDIRKLINKKGVENKQIKNDILLDFGLPNVMMTNRENPYADETNALTWMNTAHRKAVVEAFDRCNKCKCDKITIRTQLIGNDPEEFITKKAKNGDETVVKNRAYSPFILNFTTPDWAPYFMDIVVPCDKSGRGGLAK